MKKIIGFIVVVMALVLGSYFGMGVLTERAIKKNIDVLNQASGTNVVLKSYHRGLFQSQAMLTWNLHINSVKTASSQDTLIIDVPLKIEHGPIISSDGHVLFGLGHAESNVVLPLNHSKQLTAQFTQNSTKPILHLSIFVSYLNQTSIEVVVPQFNMVASRGNMHVDSKGMKLKVRISATRKQIQGEWLVDGSTWLKDQIRVALSQLRSKYSLNLNRLGLSTGEANVSVPALSMTQSGNNVLDIQNMDLHSKNEIVKGLFNSSLKATADKVTLNQKTFSSCQFALDISRLDANVLGKINDNLSKIDQNTQSVQQKIIFSVLSDLPNLLNRGAEFNLSDFSMITPDGPVTAKASFIFPNEAITNPFQLLQKLKGTGTISISAAELKTLIKKSLQHKIQQQVAKKVYSSTDNADPSPVITDTTINNSDVNTVLMTQVEKKINSLVQAGVLVINGDVYVLKFDFMDGNLKINGKSFDPSMLPL